MARKLILENLMKLAQGIGANPSKFMGTKTNISFLGKGPTKNPLFQRPLAGIDQASMKQLGPGMIPAVEDAMGFATAGKLNDIQLKILTENLSGINKVLNPPVLPSATVTPIRSGIMGAKIPSKRGSTFSDAENKALYEETSKMWPKSRLPEAGPGDIEAINRALNAKTGMSRAIARQILQQDTRLKLNPQELYSLRTGARGEDPLDLMKKYYGKSMLKYDDFLNSVNVEAASPTEFAEMILKNVRLVPQFAHGGLARILEV